MKALQEKLEAAIRAQGYGTPAQERDQAITVAALALALALMPPKLKESA